MEVKASLKAELKQEQVLNSMQQQSLKILQMSLSELRVKVEKELEENPLLDCKEEVENKELDFDIETFRNNQADDDSDRNTQVTIREKVTGDFGFNPNRNNVENEISLENIICRNETFKDYLFDQIPDIKTDKKTLALCKYMIECLDERGYFDFPIEDIAARLRLSVEKIDGALQLIQKLQPYGVGARNLKECLILQLKGFNCCYDDLMRIINNHLELIADNKIKEIAKILKIDLKTAINYCNIIKSLNPVPSSGFNTNTTEEYVIAEAMIGRDECGLYIQMNNKFIPELHMNQFYEQMFPNIHDEPTRRFLYEKKLTALAFLKSIEMRNKTIFDILNIIMKLQQDYFMNGPLKPMKISDISQQLGIHESTVSRAIRNKYIICSGGLISLKSLFTSAIGAMQRDLNVSSALVKQEIKARIEHEDKTHPLSDSDICEGLKKNNIDISRRTVAKYREEMQISSSGRRRTMA